MTPDIPYLKNMYVDLMVRILTNSIYEDQQINPHLPENYDKDRREVGGDWPKIAHTMVGAQRLRNLADLACKVLDLGIPGDFIETGVWRGGCCGVFEADAGDVHHTYKQLAVSLEEVKENISRYGLLDEQTVFVNRFLVPSRERLELKVA